MKKTKDKEYDVNPNNVLYKIDMLIKKGGDLDNSSLKNIKEIKVLSRGERSGRKLAEIEYPDGTIVLFYNSKKGSGSKTQGVWYPIAGFALGNYGRMPSGWFLKVSGVSDFYNSNIFKKTSEFLSKENVEKQEIEEIDLSVNHTSGKPGIQRKFPQEKEGGHSLNLSVSDGPHKFPNEENF